LIGVDTNVLLRVLVEDDPAQLRAAETLVNAPERAEDPVFVSPIVLVEIEWTLRRVYRRSKDEILEAMDRLQRHAHIVLDDREAVDAAIVGWRTGKASLADYLIGALARERGARTTMTFDQDAAETGAFTLLPH
jgi:predicted nucleic-acid-binding protein